MMRRFLLLTAYCLLVTVFLISCGRRGDPVLIVPDEEIDAADKAVSHGSEKVDSDISGTAEGPAAPVRPEAPKGLAAVFTGEKVILVWDDSEVEGVKFYRVYRSGEDAFSGIGETATPVFNDRDIEYGKRYFYKVSAVGQSESGLSDPVEVVTGGVR